MATDDSPRKKFVVEEVSETPAASSETPKEEVAPSDAPPADEEKKEEEVKTEDKPTEEKTEPKKEPKKAEKPASEAEEKKSLWYIFWIMIPVAIIVGGLAGGVFYYLNSVKKSEPTPTPTPVASSGTPLPSASPSGELDLTKYAIKILNGSGTAGEAGEVKTLLEEAGFSIASTGNASAYDYNDTIVQVSDKVESVFSDKLLETLAKSYAVESKTEAVPANQTGDVIIIVGSSKASSQ